MPDPNNYPPGVNGNEPDIVGRTHAREAVECANCNKTVFSENAKSCVCCDADKTKLTLWYCSRCVKTCGHQCFENYRGCETVCDELVCTDCREDNNGTCGCGKDGE